MPFDSRSRFIPWIRWIVFGMILGGVLFLCVDHAWRPLMAVQAENLSLMEKRHLRLTEQTVGDLAPEFTQSFSEPLKRMVPHRTDGYVQPLWSWVAAWMHDGGDMAGSLRRAGIVRLGLVLGFLIVLGITCARNFTLPGALMVLLISGLHGFLPTVLSYSGASLFHLFLLLGWIACVYALQRNSLWVYGLVGTFSALAYLAEDRALPLVLVFVFVSSLRAFWGWLASHWAKHGGISLWVRRNHLFGLILMISMFGFIAGSRVVEAGTMFGQGLFSYIDEVRWLDDPAAAQDWAAKHPDAQSLREITLLDRLDAQDYLQTHTPQEVRERLLRGLTGLWQSYAQDGGWQLAILWLILAALLFSVWRGTPKASHAGQRLHPETATTVLFTLGAAFVYIGIAAWDAAVWEVGHVRALLAPLALSLIWACESVLRRARRRSAAKIITLAYTSALWVMISTDLVLHWQSR